MPPLPLTNRPDAHFVRDEVERLTGTVERVQRMGGHDGKAQDGAGLRLGFGENRYTSVCAPESRANL